MEEPASCSRKCLKASDQVCLGRQNDAKDLLIRLNIVIILSLDLNLRANMGYLQLLKYIQLLMN